MKAVQRVEWSGEPAVQATVFDISDRKGAQEALRVSEAALRVSQEEFRLLAGRLLSVQEEERRRLARELHDDLTQRLAVLAIDVGKHIQQWQGVPNLSLTGLLAVQEQLIDLSADVHSLARQLHPAILDDLGLVDAIQSQCACLRRRHAIVVTCDTRQIPDAVPREVALCLYRVVQEGLRNMVRHAQAKMARVTLVGGDGTLHLTLADDGCGFDPQQVQEGLGLISMTERVRLIGGTLSVQSQPGAGTVIDVRAPLGREA